MKRTPITKGRTAAAVADDYLELVRRWPLRPIRSGTELQAATEMLDPFVGHPDLTDGQRDYVEALAHFVSGYERASLLKRIGRLPVTDLLRFLMEANGMNTADLGEVLGGRGLASEVLRGKRGLSKTLIRRLARRFQVEPGLFLSADIEEEE